MRSAFVIALLVGGSLSVARATSLGKAQVAKFAPSSFNVYLNSPNQTQKKWIDDHYARMCVFPPYFDSRLSWFPNAWAYKDLYAIYPGTALATAHPDWILRDAAGNLLYIPYACSGGTCTQYAGDVGNPAFRTDWIATATAMVAKGYLGLLIDDVNMRIDRVGNGNGTPVAPIDPRTGTTMTDANFKRYMAEFLEQIRAAFPGKEIVENDLWFNGTTDQYVQRQLATANVHSLERGVNDAGIVNGTGQFGFETFLTFTEWAHQHGSAVWFDATAGDDAGREYGLATYLLINNGADYIGNTPGAEPDNWWPGYDIDLGAPLGARTMNGAIFQRDFQNGRVLVNQPRSSQTTVQLGGTFLRVDGTSVTSVTLGAAQGVVLRRAVTGSTTTTTQPATTTTTRPSTTTTTTTHPSTTTTRPSTTTITATTTTTRPSTTTTATTTSTTRPSTTTTTHSPTTTTATQTSSTSTTSRPSTTTTTSHPSTTTTVPPLTCPSTPDTDGDGIGDACDPCTNLAAGQDRPKLMLRRLGVNFQGRLVFKGTITHVPMSPTIDPVTKGVRVMIVDSAGSVPVDVSIAGGAYDGANLAGWRVNGSQTAWLYKNAGAILPLNNGINKVELRLDATGGTLKFLVKGRNGNYPVDTSHLPLTGSLVIDAPVATTGQCGEMTFPAAPPAKGSCASSSDGSAVRCK
jgi:hypothetical protein